MRTTGDVMTREPISVGPDTLFEQAAIAMRSLHIRHLVVVTATGKLAGLLGDTAVFERGRFADATWVPARPGLSGATIAQAVRPAESVTADLPLPDLIRLLLSLDEDIVVVVDDGRHPVGVFTEHDAVRMAATEVREDLLVGTVMATALITATADMPLQDAWNELVENEVRHLPIREGNKLIGVASARDLLEVGASVAAGGTVDQLIDRKRPVHTTRRDETVRVAAARMVQFKIGCLPVLDDDGSLLGLISATDAIKALLPR